MNEMIFLL